MILVSLRIILGFLVFCLGCAMLGLDLHIAFRKTEAAHITNIIAGIFVLVLGIWLMVPSTENFLAKIKEFNWRKDK